MSDSTQKRLVLRPEAEREIAEAAEWYDRRRPGLGAEFLGAVDACIGTIHRSPELYPVVRGGLRRAVLQRFPYNLVYTERRGELVVAGRVHGRRDQQVWQDRI